MWCDKERKKLDQKNAKTSNKNSMFVNIIPKAFKNIKLVFHYSESVSHENSKCRDFASVQVKPILQKMGIFSHSKQNINYQKE